jgi:hypothetical protein
LTKGLPIKALRSERPSKAAKQATNTRKRTIRTKKRRDWFILSIRRYLESR